MGRRFRVLKPTLFFPHDFEVLEETEKLIHLKNAIETYWVTRARFEASEGTLFTELRHDHT